MNRNLLLLLISFLVVSGCHKNRKKEYPRYTANNSGIAIKNINLVPMTSEKIVKAQTVLVKDSRIVAIGSVNDVEIPVNTTIIDGSGKYLMPGLADMHMHTRHDWQSGNWPVSPLSLYLANGVTTIRDFGPIGRPADHGLHWRRAIAKGYLAGPTIYTCGKILFGPINNPAGEVEIQKEKGFDFIKFYSFLTRKEFAEGMAAVKRLQLYSAGHIPFQVGLDGTLSAGMNEIAHIEELVWEWVDFDRNKKLRGNRWLPYVIGQTFQQYEKFLEHDKEELRTVFKKPVSEVVEKMRVSKTPVCTTLAVDDVIIQKLHHAKTFAQREENRYLMNGYLGLFRQGREKHQMQFKGGEAFAHFKFRLDTLLLVELKKAGVPLLLATDAGTGGMGLVPGFSIHNELRILIENGFTPYEAIATGTINATKTVAEMTGKDDFGTIEIGKRADLILLLKNPLENVKHIKNPLGVMASGRWYDQKALRDLISAGIPVIGEIRHVKKTRAGSVTQIEILVGKNFRGRLPNDIIEIVVTGPHGKLPINKTDFTFYPQLRDFYIEIPGLPDIGSYTFTVISQDSIGIATDTQSASITIPVPAAKSMTASKGDRPQTTTPNLSWKAVKTDVPVYYRINIFNQNKTRIHRTKSVKDMVSYSVPEGVLKPDQTYFWNIRVSDSDQWAQEQNRSSSRLSQFRTSSD